jgi:hypothetical protein
MEMRRKLLPKMVLAGVCAAVVCVPVIAWAHACHDFTKGKKPAPNPSGGSASVNKANIVASQDDLIIKVDVRDGQLRIGEETSFRVYLFNTSDVDIKDVGLDVCTNGLFKAEIKPGADWAGYPALKSLAKGGKKEYFEVSLRRNPGVPDGKYSIGLNLINSKDRTCYKALDVAKAADLLEVAKAPAMKIDGNAEEAEWGKAVLCTDFYAYVAVTANGLQYRQNVAAAATPSRARLTADKDSLYCLFQFSGAPGAASDVATLYVAASADGPVAKVTFDRVGGKVSCDRGATGVEFRQGADRNTFECRIPRALLGISDARSFRANFTRAIAGRDAAGKEQRLVTYWRGNEHSLQSPLVYGQFAVPE